jgi:hypothetical protein
MLALLKILQPLDKGWEAGCRPVLKSLREMVGRKFERDLLRLLAGGRRRDTGGIGKGSDGKCCRVWLSREKGDHARTEFKGEKTANWMRVSYATAAERAALRTRTRTAQLRRVREAIMVVLYGQDIDVRDGRVGGARDRRRDGDAVRVSSHC